MGSEPCSGPSNRTRLGIVDAANEANTQRVRRQASPQRLLPAVESPWLVVYSFSFRQLMQILKELIFFFGTSLPGAVCSQSLNGREW